MALSVYCSGNGNEVLVFTADDTIVNNIPHLARMFMIIIAALS